MKPEIELKEISLETRENEVPLKLKFDSRQIKLKSIIRLNNYFRRNTLTTSTYPLYLEINMKSVSKLQFREIPLLQLVS